MSNIQAGGASYKLSLKDDLSRDLTSAMSDATSTVRSAVRAIDNEVKSIGQSIRGLGKQVAAIGAAAGAFGAGASFGFGKAVVAAGDFAETVNMFDAVFKDQASAVQEWSNTYSKEVGRSREQLMRFLAEAQDTFVPLGFDRAEAAELSKTITQLAVDLGSFKNIDDGDALRRLLGAVVGNTENLRAFGVVANQAQIQAKALDLGFDPQNLSAYEKALSIVEIAIEGTVDAQGDAVKTGGSFNNSVKRLSAAIRELITSIGEPLREVAAKFVTSLAQMIEGIAEFIDKSPAVAQIAAGLSVAMAAIGAAAFAAGRAIMSLGSVLGSAGIALFALDKIGVRLIPVFQKVVAIVGNLRTAFAGLLIRSAIKLAMKAVVATVVGGIGLITKAVTAAGALVMKSLVNPWTLLAAAIVAAAEAAKYYYKQQQDDEKRRGDQLEQERQRVVAQSFRDAGQPVPADLGKTLDVNNAFVVSNDPKQGKLSNAQVDLAEEIRDMKTPIQAFRDRIRDAGALLERGTITQEQFNKFAKAEYEAFRKQDPATQQREALADQLKTPAEKLRESILEARRLFAEDTEMFSRAVRAAREQFEATDPAEQLKQQLMTPLEIFRQSVEEAKRLFADDPEFLRRAVAAAFDTFKASQPQPKDDPAVQAANRIKESLKTDAQKVAEQIGEAASLVGRGLTGEQARTFAQRLRDDFLGDNPAVRQFRSLATRSAAVAANIGGFGPSFDNTASEERAYRRKSLKLQEAVAKELKKIRRKKLVFN